MADQQEILSGLAEIVNEETGLDPAEVLEKVQVRRMDPSAQ